MPRVKRGVTAHAKHKKVIDRPRATTAGARTSSASPSRPSSRPASTPTATGGRKSASSGRYGSSASTRRARENGLSYSRLMSGLKKAQVFIDRKVLADMAVFDKPAFAALAEQAKASLAAAA